MDHALTAQLLADLARIRPELLLVAFALSAAVFGAWTGDRASGFLSWVGAAALIGAGALALLDWPVEATSIFQGAMTSDGFSALAKAVICFSAAATLLLAAEHFGKSGEKRFEFPILTALAAIGMCVMTSAGDLITLYVGLELQSLAAYVLAAFRRDDARSSEAGLKYFVLGALSSGLLLYGGSLIYGFAGSVRFPEIASVASSVGASGDSVGLLFGLVFLLCGLAFKLSAAPFHMWTPDVYEGAPTPVTAFFAAAPKLAVVALLARVLYGPFAGMEDQWRQVILALAAITLVVGAFLALVQTNIKRLMAYSSVHNVGFALMALAAGPTEGPQAALVYLMIYLPTTIGVFACILAMRRDGKDVESLEDLSGLAKRNQWLAIVLTVLLVSLAGIPPLAGFFGKFAAFMAAIRADLIPIAVIAAVATVVSAAYYLNLIRLMWVGAPAPDFERTGATVSVTAVGAAVLAFPVLAVGVGWLERAAALASAGFR